MNAQLRFHWYIINGDIVVVFSKKRKSSPAGRADSKVMDKSIQKFIKPKKRIRSAQEQGPKTAGVSESADKSSVGKDQQRQSMLDIIEKGNAALETNALVKALAYLSEATNIAEELATRLPPTCMPK